MGQILAIVSSKGGVGKTTTAVNLAAAFASLDFPTLLVEADPQCGIVANFGFDRFDIPRGLAEVARRKAMAADVTFETAVPGLHLVSSNIWSQAEEAEYLEALTRDPLVFREMLAPMAEAYDYVVIDAPPMLGPITVAVLAAADRFIVPLQTEPQAFRALGRLVETATQVRDRLNPGLRFDGIALTMVDSRTRLSISIIEQVQNEYPDLAFGNSIPRSVRLSEMALAGRPLVVAAPSSRGGRAYTALAEEVLLKHARERMYDRAGEDSDDDPEGDDPKGPGPDGGLPVVADEATTAAVAEHGSEPLSEEMEPPPSEAVPTGSADVAPASPPGGRVAIASGRFPEEGGDIHKSVRRPANGHGDPRIPTAHPPLGTIRAIAPGPDTLPPLDRPPLDRPPLDRPPLDRPHQDRHRSDRMGADRSAAERAAGRPAHPSLIANDGNEDEWDERFVNLETYLEMESGGTAGAVAADEDEWDEEWGG